MNDLSPKLTEAEDRFEGGRRTVGLFLGPMFFLAILLVPVGGQSGLGDPARSLGAVLVLCMTWWVTEALPLPATALIGPALAVLLAVAPAKEAFAPFGDPLLFLFVGSFLIAAAMSKHGLDRRIAFFILSRPALGKSPARILIAFGVISAAISMWISNTATAAMMIPVAIGVLASIPEEEAAAASRYASALILSVAFGASIGGIGTPVGTPPNIIGIGMIGKLANRNISFFEWTSVGVPALLVVLPLMLLMLIVLHPAPPETLAGVLDHVGRERRRLGRWSRGEVAALIAFLTAVALWVTPGIAGLVSGSDSALAKMLAERLPEGPVALLAAGVLFAFPTNWPRREFALDWKTAASIDWGTVMLFGGGMSLGSMMFSTGLAKSIGETILSMTGAGAVSGAGTPTPTSAALFLGIAILAGILVSEATSNTASASMVIPVVIAIAQERGMDPLLPAIGACLGCSFGFALPVSTAPNALAYGTGKVPITRMLRAGLLLDLMGFIAIWAVLMLLAPVVGRF